jgi:hypothetical protein
MLLVEELPTILFNILQRALAMEALMLLKKNSKNDSGIFKNNFIMTKSINND